MIELQHQSPCYPIVPRILTLYGECGKTIRTKHKITKLRDNAVLMAGLFKKVIERFSKSVLAKADSFSFSANSLKGSCCTTGQNMALGEVNCTRH